MTTTSQHLFDQLVDGSLELKSLSHIDHVKVAFVALQRHAFLDATMAMANGLMNLATRGCAPTKFNATITVALMSIIAERMRSASYTGADDFVQRNPDLLKRDFLERHYSPERMASETGRSLVLLPDRNGRRPSHSARMFGWLTSQHWLALLSTACLSVAIWFAVKSRLDASYAASRYPVDYATGQLAFDARRIDGYYDAMRATGTLDIYWRTQVIDFAFIAAVSVMGLLLGAAIAKAGRARRWLWLLGATVASAAITGAMFDAIENILSFAMLQAKSPIPPALAVYYSTAAAAKFACLTLAMATFAIGAPLALLVAGLDRLKGSGKIHTGAR